MVLWLLRARCSSWASQETGWSGGEAFLWLACCWRTCRFSDVEVRSLEAHWDRLQLCCRPALSVLRNLLTLVTRPIRSRCADVLVNSDSEESVPMVNSDSEESTRDHMHLVGLSNEFVDSQRLDSVCVCLRRFYVSVWDAFSKLLQAIRKSDLGTYVLCLMI